MIRFSCPGCGAVYSVTDDKAGKTGKCPKCQTPFTIPAAEAPAPVPPPPPVSSNPFAELSGDDAPRKKKSPSKADLDDAPPKKKPARRDDEDDDYDDAPPKKSKGRRDDDDDYDDAPPPKKKPARRDEDDDYDDAPPVKKSAPAATGGDAFADFDATPSSKKKGKGRRDDDDDYDDAPPKKKGKGRAADDDYDDDYDDAPPKKKAKGRAADDDYDDDYDDRPRKKGRRDDDDDYDDDYDRPRKKKGGKSGLLLTAAILHIITAVIYLPCGGLFLAGASFVSAGVSASDELSQLERNRGRLDPNVQAAFQERDRRASNAKTGLMLFQITTVLTVLAGCIAIPACVAGFTRKKWFTITTLITGGMLTLSGLLAAVSLFGFWVVQPALLLVVFVLLALVLGIFFVIAAVNKNVKRVLS